MCTFVYIEVLVLLLNCTASQLYKWWTFLCSCLNKNIMAYIKCLLLLLLVPLACSVCVQKSCPIGSFCPNGANCDDTNLCVEQCNAKNQQGNWSSGNCEAGIACIQLHLSQLHRYTVLVFACSCLIAYN